MKWIRKLFGIFIDWWLLMLMLAVGSRSTGVGEFSKTRSGGYASRTRRCSQVLEAPQARQLADRNLERDEPLPIIAGIFLAIMSLLWSCLTSFSPSCCSLSAFKGVVSVSLFSYFCFGPINCWSLVSIMTMWISVWYDTSLCDSSVL